MIYSYADGTPLYSRIEATGELTKITEFKAGNAFGHMIEVGSGLASQLDGQPVLAQPIVGGPFDGYWVLGSAYLTGAEASKLVEQLTPAQYNLVAQGIASNNPKAQDSGGGVGLIAAGLALLGGAWWLARRKK